MEIDLVGHDGGDASDDFCQPLDVTDVVSCWTETEAVINKAQVRVFGALQSIRNRLPFPLLGIDSDNGSEFINHQLLRYCQGEQITFTRGRSGKKNDGCFVEQKNYSVVRRAVGYARYDSAAQLKLLNELYGHLRLYTNYFQPVMKLKAKERNPAVPDLDMDAVEIHDRIQRIQGAGLPCALASSITASVTEEIKVCETSRPVHLLEVPLGLPKRSILYCYVWGRVNCRAPKEALPGWQEERGSPRFPADGCRKGWSSCLPKKAACHPVCWSG